MKIIDFHAHVYPEKIATKAVENVGAFYTLDMHGEGTVEKLLEHEEKAGVGTALIHSPAILPSNVQTINSFIAGEVKAHPDKLCGYGTLHAEMESPEEEIERIIELGLIGIKLHPDSQHFNIDDERMMKLYPLLAEKGLPVLFHVGDYRYDYSHPERLARVIDAFPKLCVIGAHFGGWSLPDLALEFLRDRNCYLDVSSSLAFIGSVRAKELIRLYGADRMLFGTDFPMWTPEEEIARFMDIRLTDNENERILYDNAAEILHLN